MGGWSANVPDTPKDASRNVKLSPIPGANPFTVQRSTDGNS